MGADKTRLDVGGMPAAARAARALAPIARPVLAVGGEAGTGLESVADPGQGPLVAFVAGTDALAERDARGPILLVACDLPLISAHLLSFLAHELGDADACVPVVGGRDQPLAACYAPGAAEAARALVADGVRSMQALLEAVRVRRVDESAFAHVASPDELRDVDTPEDLDAVRRILDAPA